MNTKSILVFFFIVLIIYVTLTPVSVSYHKRCIFETFAEQQQQPSDFGVLNTYAKRALAFQPPHSNSLASQRSEIANALAFDSTANCTTTYVPDNVNNESQSLVAENNILYKLASSCFSFKTKGLHKDKLVLDIESSKDWYKFVYFILLNPIFIEVNKDNHTTTSMAYYPRYRTNQAITNRGHGDFSVVREQNNGPNPYYDGTLINLQRLTGNLFDYSKNKAYTYISNLKITKDNAVNIKTFYVRPHDTAQTVGTVIPYRTTPKNGQYLVSSSTYHTLPSEEKTQSLKMFSATIDKYFNSLSRTAYPTFTTTFKLNLNGHSTHNNGETEFMIFEMFMNNSFGINTNCNKNVIYQPQFAKNGNIFSMTIQYPKIEAKLIKLKMGTSIGGCLFQSNFINLYLPYFQNTKTEATCILTFSPYTIDFLSYWVNPDKDKNDNIEFIYQQKIKNNPNNDFSQLFMGVSKDPNMKFADIIINTDTVVVPIVNEVSLGHRNMAELLYKAIHEGQ
jgi:hypothetical protein